LIVVLEFNALIILQYHLNYIVGVHGVFEISILRQMLFLFDAAILAGQR
jgi:hypothetical protein